MEWRHLILEPNIGTFLTRLIRRMRMRERGYGILFGGLTIISTLFMLISSLVATLKLAANKVSYLADILQGFQGVDDNGTVVDILPIFIVGMSVGLSLCTALLGYFLVKQRWYEYSYMNRAIKLELECYENRIGIYRNRATEYQLFKRICAIARISNRYANRRQYAQRRS